MNKYAVILRYFRPSGTQGSAFYEVEAASAKRALNAAKKLAESEPQRRIAAWDECEVSLVLPKPAAPVWGEPTPIHAGDEITVLVPLKGVVNYVTEDRVEIVQRGGYRRTMPVAYLEQLTGRKVAPRPPVVTIEYHSIYPNGANYMSDRPVLSSSHGVENLIQVKVTKHDGKIVKKEII